MSNKNHDQQHALQASAETLETATGTKDPVLQVKIVNQALSAYDPNGDVQAQGSAALELLASIAPKDAVEGMLAAQMVSSQDTASRLLRLAFNSNQSVPAMDMLLKHAGKFQQLYARQVEALTKYRGKGSQKITVEHVTVEAGGQAIVGNVSAGAARPPRSSRPAQVVLDESGNELDVPVRPASAKSKTPSRGRLSQDE
jgi:hypothetical protein